MRTGEWSEGAPAAARSRWDEPTWDDQPRGSFWRLLRGAVAVALILFLGVVAVVGQRPSTWSQLEAEVAAGQVDTVRVVGGMQSGGRGYATVEVTWQRGAFHYWAEVVEARPLRAGEEARSGLPVVRDVEAALTDLRPDLALVAVPRPRSSSTMFGWQLPGWTGWLALGVFLATLTLVTLGPQPWRATRAAWFWLCFLALPVGGPAFLVLGGPVPLVRPPRPGSRCLTGGWGFLLAMLLAAALTPSS